MLAPHHQDYEPFYSSKIPFPKPSWMPRASIIAGWGGKQPMGKKASEPGEVIMKGTRMNWAVWTLQQPCVVAFSLSLLQAFVRVEAWGWKHIRISIRRMRFFCFVIELLNMAEYVIGIDKLNGINWFYMNLWIFYDINWCKLWLINSMQVHPIRV